MRLLAQLARNANGLGMHGPSATPVRNPVSPMTDFHVERFTKRDDLQWAGWDEEPPATGWAFVGPGDVYLDGV